jgi:subtilisin-like proprotein convertase family protein
LQTSADCATAGGAYKGDGTPCAANTCDCNNNMQCDQIDIVPQGGMNRNYSNAPALAIPDAPAAGVSDVINVGASGIIFDVNVSMDITHTFIGDLQIEVEHGGVTVVIWDNVCGGNNDLNVTVDDAGPAVVCAEPTVGVMAPSGVLAGALAAFNGMNKMGPWTITITDQAGADVGTLNMWSLDILNDATLVDTDCNGNTIPDDCEMGADCDGDGILDECEVASGDNIPPGGDGIPDDCNCVNDSDCGPGMACDECAFTCMPAGTPCADAEDCRNDGDNNACNGVSCPAGFCVYQCIRFGDVAKPHNNIVNLDDILCVLSGFGNFNLCPNGDIAPCGGNGIINLDDILAVLAAFGGANTCNCMQAGVAPLCGSISP